MKKQKCKHCEKETSRVYREYHNPAAGLWGVTTCAECGQIDSIEDVQAGFANLATRHRWYLPVLRIACAAIFVIFLGYAVDSSLDGRLRLTLGIIGALVPGLYGGLKGSPGERTTATNKQELEELIGQRNTAR